MDSVELGMMIASYQKWCYKQYHPDNLPHMERQDAFEYGEKKRNSLTDFGVWLRMFTARQEKPKKEERPNGKLHIR